MYLAQKKILLISPEPWDHIYVSKHHYAIYLASRNNQVYFLNPPSRIMQAEPTGIENLTVIDYRGFIRGLRFFPQFLRRRWTRNVLRQIQALAACEFDVIWSFDNSVFYDFSIFKGSCLTISHIVDLNQHFQTERAARSAHFCFCTTELIKARLLKFNPNVLKIGHGLNPGAFNNGMRLPGSAKVKIVYSGNLAMPYIDWILLRKVVKENAGLDFIFIGPHIDVFNSDRNNNDAKSEVRYVNNAYFIGKVHAHDLPGYYAAADVLIVSYQEKFHRDQANPHKMMEYLGSGKMIVATFTSEYSELKEKEWIAMSLRNDDFPELLGEVLRNLSFWNAPDKQFQRKTFALDNTYAKQVKRIEDYINERKIY